MDLIKLIILSIIQGICEVLPISSSGHLILFKQLLGINTYGLTLEIILHIGSLIAVVFYYKKELFEIITYSLNYLKGDKNSKKHFNLLLYLFISTFVTSIIALLFNSFIENFFSNIVFLPIFFLITSIIITFSNHNSKTKSIYDISLTDAIIVGLFQGIGIIPGISRSGITYFSLIFPPYYYIIAVIISGITTYFSLILFSKIINRNKYYFFSIYLIILSSIIILFL